MDLSLFLNIVAAAIGFILIFRKLRSHQENKESDSSSLSTSPSPSPLSISSVPQSPSPHDVFPSFRGEDVRRDFLSHIQKEFTRKGITLFNDNGIERGESIAPELIRGIRGSKIAIVLLSRNYASSKWCLEELVEIMKCREELGQKVMAVFYKVDPSDVKKLSGDFGKVFRKTCEGKAKEDITRWKQALEKVATIAGYHSSNWDNEASMVEEIATDISNELIKFGPSSDFKGFVGMEAHMKKMEPFLLLGSKEVRMIGIWGPSGIGKSTIARVLFSQHSHEFQLSVFMENIKRRCPRPCSDEYSAKLQLQEEFLSKIVNQEDIKIHHLGVAPDRLKDKRVLVVLDDVDHLMQLDAMAKDLHWFGPGSRIIVTTQDKKLLTAHGIEHIYKVEFPGFREALEIFCMNAFGQKSPDDGFEELAREVTELVGKLPLGLKVMGSYFKGMAEQEWEEELSRLRTRLDGEIESILKLSYDALCVDDQDLFLHLACFFNNERIEKVEEYLARNFVGVKGRLRVLVEKSFISVEWGGYIRIHDLLARLGTEIVRKQSIHEPGQRQFLADVGDICQVLRNETLGSPSVIGIDLKLTELKTELKISDRAFERMFNVQFLRLLHSDLDFDYGRPRHTCHYSIDLMTCLPPNLRLLHWDFFPLTCLPSNFIPEFLVELALRKSNYLEKLWEGNETIRNLKWMYLSDSKNLKKLPDLSTATNLEELDLSHCSSLVDLPFSIGNAFNLIRLDLSHCSSLVGIPSSIWNLVNLPSWNLSHCSSLVRLPSSSGEAIIKLKVLKLHGCTSLMELPSSMKNATNLEELDLTGCLHISNLPHSMGNLKKIYLEECSSLVELPSSVRNSLNLKAFTFKGCSNLVELPSYLGNATDLKKFDLGGCSSLRELPSSIGNMTNLQRLCLNGCSSLVELPPSIGNMTTLMELCLNGCSSLLELPSSIGNITNLRKLCLNECSSLRRLPSSIGNMTNLEKLYLNGCSRLQELSSSTENITNLVELRLNEWSSLRKLPSSIGNMTNLHQSYLNGCSNLQEPSPFAVYIKNLMELHLNGCSSLHKLLSYIGNMTNLMELRLYGCSSLLKLSSSIENMTNLKKLYLNECSSLAEFPSSIGNMTNLMDLRLNGCSSLQKIPSYIGNMTNLQQLYLNGCSCLRELPSSIGNMTNLVELRLNGCSSLRNLSSSIGNMTNLQQLYLNGCSSLRKLSSSIGNITNLMELHLNGCSSLRKLPSSIGNMTNLQHLSLNDCSSLQELPSSIGNITNLQKLYLSGCSSLRKLPTSIGYMINLMKLCLTGCSNLVELPSSIRNMTNLKKLSLRGCSKLTALPININMKSLDTLVLTDCSSLKSFPEIPTNIRILRLVGTAIQEIPSSIRSWSCLEDFHISYFENLKKYHHAFDRITKLHFSDTRIQEIAPWIKEMSRLRHLVIKGCTKLMSLPQLPDSLKILVADNCKSLERLDGGSFYNTKFHGLSFVNCFKLNQEARDLIISASTRDLAVFPGETVPTYFSYRATGSSLSMTWNGLYTHYFPTSLRFRACLLLVYKGDVDAGDWCWPEISYCIKDKLNGVKSGYVAYAYLWHRSSPTSKEHLLVVKIEETVGSPELAFEFRSHDKNWEIEECGLRSLEIRKVGNLYFEILAPSC